MRKQRQQKHPLDQILEEEFKTIKRSIEQASDVLKRASRDRLYSYEEQRMAKDILRKLGRIHKEVSSTQQRDGCFAEITAKQAEQNQWVKDRQNRRAQRRVRRRGKE